MKMIEKEALFEMKQPKAENMHYYYIETGCRSLEM